MLCYFALIWTSYTASASLHYLPFDGFLPPPIMFPWMLPCQTCFFTEFTMIEYVFRCVWILINDIGSTCLVSVSC